VAGLIALRKGERSWLTLLVFVPAVVVGGFWIFFALGEVLSPHQAGCSNSKCIRNQGFSRFALRLCWPENRLKPLIQVRQTPTFGIPGPAGAMCAFPIEVC
jgi:hypothetical protein